MATLASAQLVSAITANQTVFGIQNVVTPAGSVGFPPVGVYANPQQPFLIDNEIMYIVVQNPSGTLQVRSRGAEGSGAVAHDALSNCYTGLPSDFGPVPFGTSGFLDPNQDTAVSIGTTPTTLVIGAGNNTYNINVATAAAITLPAPSLAANGSRLTFTSNTANAHVITCTNAIQSGSGTQPKSTITFPAIIGASVILIAENGFWNVATPTASITVA